MGEVLNLGSNFEISIGETVRMIAEIAKADVPSPRRTRACAGGERSRAAVG